jgi:hypothetical protein
MADHGLGVHGAATMQEALARFGAARVARATASGEWCSPWRGVLVEASRAAEPLTVASAAVRLAGTGAGLLCGPTAACLHGCTAVDPLPVHLMVPHGHWLRSRSGLVVHNGPLPDDERELVLELPVLTLKRVITDLLCTAPQQDALAALDEVLAEIEPDRRELFRADIADRLATRADNRGTRRAERLLGLATGCVASPAESWLLWRIVDSGFPVPKVNVAIHDLDGHVVYRLDLAWTDLRIALEYDGYLAHLGRECEDEARAGDLRRRGWIVVRARREDLSLPARLERDLDDAFRRRGLDMSRRRVGTLQPRRHRQPARVPTTRHADGRPRHAEV